MALDREIQEVGDNLAAMLTHSVHALTRRGTFAKKLVKLLDQVSDELVKQEVVPQEKAVDTAIKLLGAIGAHKSQ